jgi:SP family myo-inositol transporter-like MFS transporter 13
MVSTTLAAIFLPFAGKHGYSTIFFVFAGFSLCYLLAIALFLPETKGKSLEQIEQFFDPAWNEVGIE